MKSKKWRILLPLLLLAVIGVASTSAFLISKAGTVTNLFTAAEVTTEILEELDENEIVQPGTEIKKVVTVRNIDSDGTLAEVGTDDAVACFVRVRITASPANLLGDGRQGFIFEGMDAAWVNGGDGYYYYLYALAPYVTTTPVMEKVVLSAGLTTNFDLTVTQEAVNSQAYTSQALEDGTYPLEVLQAAFADVTL